MFRGGYYWWGVMVVLFQYGCVEVGLLCGVCVVFGYGVVQWWVLVFVCVYVVGVVIGDVMEDVVEGVQVVLVGLCGDFGDWQVGVM